MERSLSASPSSLSNSPSLQKLMTSAAASKMKKELGLKSLSKESPSKESSPSSRLKKPATIGELTNTEASPPTTIDKRGVDSQGFNRLPDLLLLLLCLLSLLLQSLPLFLLDELPPPLLLLHPLLLLLSEPHLLQLLQAQEVLRRSSILRQHQAGAQWC